MSLGHSILSSGSMLLLSLACGCAEQGTRSTDAASFGDAVTPGDAAAMRDRLLGDAAADLLTDTPADVASDGPRIGPSNMSMLVVRVDRSSASVPCSESDLLTSTFGNTDSVSAVFWESSRGAVVFGGDVTTVDVGQADLSSKCRVGNDTALADTINAATAIDPNSYDKIAYVLPGGTCPWGGNYSMAGGKKYLYTTKCEQPRILAHELAHTFGMQHASTEAGHHGSILLSDEYGDHSDPLGGGNAASLTQLNAPHLDQKTWLPVEEITTGGDHAIDCLEADLLAAPTNPQILRLDASGQTDYFYVSLRCPIGVDRGMVGYIPKTNMGSDIASTTFIGNLSVHRFKKSPYRTGYKESMTYLVALLGSGETFNAAAAGLSITVKSITSTGATVGITM